MQADFRNILVIKMSSMGDVLHALPAICLLRDRFPGARITWLIDHRFAALVAGHPAVDELVVSTAPPWVERLGPLAHVARGAYHLTTAWDLSARSFDLVVDLQGLFKTGVLAASTLAKRRLGFANAREAATLFYSNTQRVPIGIHAVTRYVRLVETIAGPAGPIHFDLPVASNSRRQARQLLDRAGIGPDFVVVAPRSSRREKNWPAARFAEVVRSIWRDWGVPSAVIGGNADRASCDQVVHDSDSPAVAVVGEPLSTITAILEQARLLIGLDSGPIHLAAALGRPVVSIFGPTDPVRFAPWGSQDLVVRSAGDCLACRAARIAGSIAHKSLRHRCIEDVTAEQVISVVARALSRSLIHNAAG